MSSDYSIPIQKFPKSPTVHYNLTLPSKRRPLGCPSTRNSCPHLHPPRRLERHYVPEVTRRIKKCERVMKSGTCERVRTGDQALMRPRVAPKVTAGEFFPRTRVGQNSRSLRENSWSKAHLPMYSGQGGILVCPIDDWSRE